MHSSESDGGEEEDISSSILYLHLYPMRSPSHFTVPKLPAEAAQTHFLRELDLRETEESKVWFENTERRAPPLRTNNVNKSSSTQPTISRETSEGIYDWKEYAAWFIQNISRLFLFHGFRLSCHRSSQPSHHCWHRFPRRQYQQNQCWTSWTGGQQTASASRTFTKT